MQKKKARRAHSFIFLPVESEDTFALRLFDEETFRTEPEYVERLLREWGVGK